MQPTPNGNPQQQQPDGYSPYGEHADLDRFGGEASPEHAFPPGVETLSDGDYEMEVTHANLVNLEGSKVVRVGLRVLNAGGRKVEHTYWLNKQNSVNGFLAEMASLGFPAHTWGQGPGKTPLSAAVPACVQRLPGLRFRARKSSRVVPARDASPGVPKRDAATYHDLFIAGRVTGTPMPQAAQAPQQQPAQQHLQPAGTQTKTFNDDDIPFSFGPFLPWLTAAAAALGGLLA